MGVPWRYIQLFTSVCQDISLLHKIHKDVVEFWLVWDGGVLHKEYVEWLKVRSPVQARLPSTTNPFRLNWGKPGFPLVLLLPLHCVTPVLDNGGQGCLWAYLHLVRVSGFCRRPGGGLVATLEVAASTQPGLFPSADTARQNVINLVTNLRYRHCGCGTLEQLHEAG